MASKFENIAKKERSKTLVLVYLAHWKEYHEKDNYVSSLCLLKEKVYVKY